MKRKYSNFGNVCNVINNSKTASFKGDGFLVIDEFSDFNEAHIKNIRLSKMGVGMPTQLLLNEFGSKIIDAFDEVPFHVGSSLWNKTGWRDVDVRLILDDEKYESMGFGDPRYYRQNKKWISMCLAFSLMGKYMTGLPIDFQIQQRTYANKNFKGNRSVLGMVPHRIKK